MSEGSEMTKVLRFLKKGKQNKNRPNSKPKNTKGTCKRKTYFEESESVLPTGIEENKLNYDDDSDDEHHFTD
jgi:predicted RNA-binding protein with RPS1 domain